MTICVTELYNLYVSLLNIGVGRVGGFFFMNINLKDYRNRTDEFVAKDFTLLIDEIGINRSEDFRIIDPVFVNAEFGVLDCFVKFKFHISTKFEFICSRCLNGFFHDFRLSVNDELLLDDLDEDVILDEDENLDFTPYIRGVIISNIPQKKLCNSDCLGLCQLCGTNLNDKICACDNNGDENAFSQLRGFFVDLKEVE